jgi:hypothetical protein
MGHETSETYYTSDFDLSKFSSNYYGLNLRYSSADGVMGIKAFHSIELRYGYYVRSTGLSSQIVTVALKFK